MNDQDYIKKAVELADGWYWGVNDLVDPPPELRPIGPVNDTLPQIYLDALAAQLVRQVDATDYEIRMQLCAATIFYAGDEFWQLGGKGRTMNTIKAIVDSKVLE